MNDLDVTPAAHPVLEDFRHAMRRVASGVALVTTADDAGNRYGMAMTAFMSLSFDPPSLIIAVNRTASMHKPLLKARSFCINVLAARQKALCHDFVSRPSHERFGVGEWHAEAGGLPYLAGAQSNIFCSIESHQSSGSHDLIVGLVQKVINFGEIVPLVFVNGRYSQVA